MNSTHHLILASNSPRRQELLQQAGFEFEIFVQDIPEDFPDHLPPLEVAEYLANLKNQHYRKVLKDQVIITADTTVVNGSKVLNKPASKNEAKEMLLSLSGKTHQVVCGVSVSNDHLKESFTEITEVSFLAISDSEVDYYIEQYQPFDKAGAYGIQEWIGLTKVSGINGSYYNVMGLPMHHLYEVLTTKFSIFPK